MEAFRAWILCITVCAAAGTVVFVLVPRGSMERSIRSVLALFMIYVIASPLVRLKDIKIDTDGYEKSYSRSAADYADVVKNRMLDAADDAVIKAIYQAIPSLDNGSTKIEVVSALNGENSVYVERVTVNLNGSGLSASKIKKELLDKLGLTAEVKE